MDSVYALIMVNCLATHCSVIHCLHSPLSGNGCKTLANPLFTKNILYSQTKHLRFKQVREFKIKCFCDATRKSTLLNLTSSFQECNVLEMGVCYRHSLIN